MVSLGVILLDLHNSSDDTQPHPMIVKFTYVIYQLAASNLKVLN